MNYNPRDENSIKAVMAKANVVINLIGYTSSHVILHLECFESGGKFFFLSQTYPGTDYGFWQEESMKRETTALRK